jgi:hypothetical protein
MYGRYVYVCRCVYVCMGGVCSLIVVFICVCM